MGGTNWRLADERCPNCWRTELGYDGSIGDVSARLGCEVRDPKMAGCSDAEINQVLIGHKTLDKLPNNRPGSVD